jgi:hypothetical protein
VTDSSGIRIADGGTTSAVVDAFRRGHGTLTALGLYYALERSTPLLEFHTYLREGPQNCDGNGLQQSYGDHNRLLMLALDKLVTGDLDWYRDRVDSENGVTDAELAEMLGTAARLDLSRDALVAVWLAGALHDCGMLAGRGAAVDVEDGVVIGREVVDALCPPELRGLALFVLRHHDYVKDVFLGEVPAVSVSDELEKLDATLRSTALAALGLVQVAGAASLGVGRLNAFRLRIFRRCLDGTALADQSRSTRLARLLSPLPERRVEPVRGDDASGIESFLEHVPVHRWHRVFAGAGREQRLEKLAEIDARWAASEADRVVVLGPDLASPGRVDTARSGSRVLLLGEPAR